MSKKHFYALANALSAERPDEHWDANKKVQWDKDVRAVANVCGHFNGQFDYHRFITACGGLFNV